MKTDETITLDSNRVFELVQIIFDNDKDAAFKFLEETIYKPLQKRKEHKCKPSV